MNKINLLDIGDEVFGLETMDRIRREEIQIPYNFNNLKVNVGSSTESRMYEVGKDGRWDLRD